MRMYLLRVVLVFAILFCLAYSEVPDTNTCVGDVCQTSPDTTTTTITPKPGSDKSIAVIGGGIGGSSVAYYLSELIPGASITVYEKDDEPCGRLRDTIINGRKVEVGGSIYHKSNLNVDGFVRLFNLTKSTPFGQSSMGIWDGKEFIFQSSTIPILGDIIDLVTLFYRYGLSPYRLKNYLNSLMSNWTQLYEINEPSDTVKEFYERIGLLHNVESLAPDHLELQGISRNFTRDLLGPLTRMNYNSPVDVMNSFAVAVSAIGSGDSVYGVEEGNKHICSNLVRLSKVEGAYRSEVHTISKEANGKFTVNSKEYDAVVVAAPLELAKIIFHGVDVDKSLHKAREYRLVYVTFVAGTLNPTYFHVEGSEVPSVVLTVEEPDIPFSSIGRSSGITLDDGRPVSKIFSIAKLTSQIIDSVFINGTIVHETAIHAYPILVPPKEYTPFKLAENLYYVNAMESVVSTIETEIISAKNVARLVAKSWGLNYTQPL